MRKKFFAWVVFALIIPFLIMGLAVETAFARPLELLGFYRTPLINNPPNRLINVKLAAEKINGYELNAGQIFSFNQVVGPRTKERGYREAIIFLGGEEVLELGGGICQVSSTLYQAALLAGLEIIEVHPHSKPVNYIAPGKDATVYYGHKDLKFRNNTSDKLLLECLVADKEVWAAVYKILGQPVKVYLDGELLQGPLTPYLTKGTVYVPLRSLAEKMGFYVEWVGEKGQILLKKNDVQIGITIGSSQVSLDDGFVEVGSAPTIVNGYTLVPVRFVAETFGSAVQWHGHEQAVYITSLEPRPQLEGKEESLENSPPQAKSPIEEEVEEEELQNIEIE